MIVWLNIDLYYSFEWKYYIVIQSLQDKPKILINTGKDKIENKNLIFYSYLSFQTTCLTELPDVAPCNGTVRLPTLCEDSPSSIISKERREDLIRHRWRIVAPVLIIALVLLLGGISLPFLLKKTPVTPQQRLDVIRRILTEVPLIDG